MTASTGASSDPRSQLRRRLPEDTAAAKQGDHHRLDRGCHVDAAGRQRAIVAEYTIKGWGRVPVEQLGDRFDSQHVIEQRVGGH